MEKRLEYVSSLEQVNWNHEEAISNQPTSTVEVECPHPGWDKGLGFSNKSVAEKMGVGVGWEEGLPLQNKRDFRNNNQMGCEDLIYILF